MNAAIKTIGTEHGIRWERSSEDASLASDRSLPRDHARRLVAALEAAGVEASDATDGDDASRSWVHVTA